MLRMSIAGAAAGVNFVILKINETDVTNLTPEKTVDIFLRAKDPIFVKIRRRRPDDGPNQLNLFDDDSWTYASTPKRFLTNDDDVSAKEAENRRIVVSHVQCQTDVSSTTLYYAHETDESGDNGDDAVDSGCRSAVVATTTATTLATLTTTAKSTAATTTTITTATPTTSTDCCHRLIDTQTIFAHCFAPEIDIEEVTLRKSRSDEKLGLTVSYSSVTGSTSISASDEDEDEEADDDEDDDEDDSENMTEDDNDDVHDHDYDNTRGDIYICDILPDSIAARDGRLRQGDQIIQINGKDISSKDETESLFAENKNSITLLVSRCVYTDDEFLDSAIYCDDKDQNTGMSLSIDCEPSTYSSKSSLRSLSDAHQKQPPVPLQSITSLDTNVQCDHANIRAQLESVNKEISLLNSQISNMKFQKDTPAGAIVSQALPQLTQTAALLASLELQQTSLASSSSMKVAAKSNISVSSPINQKVHKAEQDMSAQVSAERKKAAVGGETMNATASIVACLPPPPPPPTPVISSAKTHHPPTHQPPPSKLATQQQFHQHHIETEHIYETIPEDSETDSYYCSPYDDQRDQSRIEQWLKSQHIGAGVAGDSSKIATEIPAVVQAAVAGGPQQICAASASATTTTPVLPSAMVASSRRDYLHNQTTFSRVYRNNSSGDDYENSSSAYNTGDSCTSNPLTFELKAEDMNRSSSTLVFRPYSRQLDAYDNCKQCQQLHVRKDKGSGIKASSRKSATTKSGGGDSTCDQSSLIHRLQQQQYQTGMKPSQLHHPLPARNSGTPSTPSTVKSDISRTIKLENKLFRKAVTHNQQKISEISSNNSSSSKNHPSQMISSPSQYQIVRNTATSITTTSAQQQQGGGSGKQITASDAQPFGDNNTMVWKVKRRTDGSRYIVRRPAVRQSSGASSSTLTPEGIGVSCGDYSTTGAGSYTRSNSTNNKSTATLTTLNIDQDQIICNTSGGGVVVHDEIITIMESSTASFASAAKQHLQQQQQQSSSENRSHRNSGSKLSMRHATREHRRQSSLHHQQQQSIQHHTQHAQHQHHHATPMPLPHHQPHDSMSSSVTCPGTGNSGGRHVQKQWVI